MSRAATGYEAHVRIWQAFYNRIGMGLFFNKSKVLNKIISLHNPIKILVHPLKLNNEIIIAIFRL